MKWRVILALLLVPLLGSWSRGGNLNFYNDGASMAPQVYTGSAGIYAPSTKTNWLFWEGWQPVAGTSQRVVEVTTYNFATNTWNPNVIAGTNTLTGDNHGVPSVTRDPASGCVYAFYGAHNDQQDLQIAKTTTCGDPSAWSASSLSLATYGNMSFINSFVVGSTLFLFYDTDGVYLQQDIAVTTASIAGDGTLTWSGTSQKLVDVGNPGWLFPGSFVQNGTNIYFGFNYGTAFATYPTQNIYIVGYDTMTGNIFNGSGYSVVQASQPVNKTTLDAHFVAHTSTDSGAPAIVSDSNGIHVVYTDNTTGTTFLNYTLNGGSSWSSPLTLYTYASSSDIPTPGMVSSTTGGLDVYFSDAADSPPANLYADGAGNVWTISRSATGSWGTATKRLAFGWWGLLGFVPVQGKPGEMIFQEVSYDGQTIAGNLRGWVYTVGQGFLGRPNITLASTHFP